MSNTTLTPFQQMRLRAIKFQEMTDCHLEMIDGTISIYSTDGYESVTAYKNGRFEYTKVTTERCSNGATDHDFGMYAAKWWRQRFPIALELTRYGEIYKWLISNKERLGSMTMGQIVEETGTKYSTVAAALKRVDLSTLKPIRNVYGSATEWIEANKERLATMTVDQMSAESGVKANAFRMQLLRKGIPYIKARDGYNRTTPTKTHKRP